MEVKNPEVTNHSRDQSSVKLGHGVGVEFFPRLRGVMSRSEGKGVESWEKRYQE